MELRPLGRSARSQSLSRLCTESQILIQMFIEYCNAEVVRYFEQYQCMARSTGIMQHCSRVALAVSALHSPSGLSPPSVVTKHQGIMFSKREVKTD
jgi:hypothetical protein